jgi:beta-glucosidase
MKKEKIVLLTLLMSLTATNGLMADTLPYQDTNLSAQERARDLVSRMTLAEKIEQMGHQTPTISRLGIQGYNYWNEGLHGVARSGLATSFPSSRAMSSTWDLPLVFSCADATSTEARVYNNTKSKGLTYWCPTINMSRDPRWGRDEENYGEDPFLTSRLCVEYIKGMQGNNPKYFKTIATVKHFACNNYEGGRHNTSATVTARDLREYYLPGFEAAVKEGNVQSLMSAYNAVNGIPCGANHELLIDILRNEWNFKGFVVSDCGAVDDIYQNHKYVGTGEAASAVAIKNGMDLNCGSTFQDYFQKAVDGGLCSEADLDSALVRVFSARFLTGEFDTASLIPWRGYGNDSLFNDYHRALALQAAHESIVLLKNDNHLLPIDTTKVKTIAVIGPSANCVQLGGYAGSPTVQTSPLQGIADKLNIVKTDGTIQAEDYQNHHAKNSRFGSEAGGTGMDIGYISDGDWVSYNGVDFGEGKTSFSINAATPNDGGSVSVFMDNLNDTAIAKVNIPNTGSWTAYKTTTVAFPKTTGKHNVYLKFNGNAKYLFNVDWLKFFNVDDPNPWSSGPLMYAQGCGITGSITQAQIDSAVTIAKKADVVVMVLGTDLTVSDEGKDRSNLNLPGSQEKLLEAICAENKNIILVLESNSSLTISWAKQNVPAILEGWYNGESQGTALADVLFGDYNPQGKLTTTWYASITDLPAINDYNIHKGRTYMYYNNAPMYPFGYGMSYTTYEYSDLKISKNKLAAGDSLTVTASISNTGKRAGYEIVQLYVHANSSIERPNKELKDFTRVYLSPGETKTVTMTLKHEQLAYYNDTNNTFDVENGTVDIMVGASSADIRLKGQISTDGATVKGTYLHPLSTGIKSICNPSCEKCKNNKIYCIDGKTMTKDSTLNSGIYIINGKKVAVH